MNKQKVAVDSDVTILGGGLAGLSLALQCRQQIPHARRVREASPGETVTWDVDLVPGPTIRGKVIYADGAPMPHVFVPAEREEMARG